MVELTMVEIMLWDGRYPEDRVLRRFKLAAERLALLCGEAPERWVRLRTGFYHGWGRAYERRHSP